MNPLFNISYGLYILTAKSDKYNGCIINTLMQVTSNPNRISITVNKDNFTTKIIEETGEFNVSILDKTTDFETIKKFGFSSGKDVYKFDNFCDYKLSENKIPYITRTLTSNCISPRVPTIYLNCFISRNIILWQLSICFEMNIWGKFSHFRY